jgi:hypothetical protein
MGSVAILGMENNETAQTYRKIAITSKTTNIRIYE